MKKIDIAEVIIVSGWAVILAGVWRIYPPAALVFWGLTMVILGVGLAKPKRGEE